MAGKALFLDRDGVVNVDGGYVHRIEDFRLVPGILNLCRQAKEKGYLVLVATNQSGIGRGMFSEDDFERLTEYMRGCSVRPVRRLQVCFTVPARMTDIPTGNRIPACF